MATYKDPTHCFAPLEVIDRILEMRVESGFPETLYVENIEHLTDLLDAYGFDAYSLDADADLDFGGYSIPIVPGGDALHISPTGH